MVFHPFRSLFVLVLVPLVIFTGCASTQTSRFYALSAMSAPVSDATSNPSVMGAAIGVGPIKMADYLDRPEVVTRNNRAGIRISEFDRWAGQLKDSFLGVLSENLAMLLSTDRVVQYPWRGSIPLDYSVEIEVIQFDGEPGNSATLVARWIILTGNSNQVLAMKRSHMSEPVSTADYSAMVDAQSRLLLSLSREISEQIEELHQEKSVQ